MSFPGSLQLNNGSYFNPVPSQASAHLPIPPLPAPPELRFLGTCDTQLPMTLWPSSFWSYSWARINTVTDERGRIRPDHG